MPELVLSDVQIGLSGPVGHVLIRDGVVAALSATRPDTEVSAEAEVVSLVGRTVLPGLWDAHVHIEQWAMARRRVDLVPANSAADAAALMAAAARDGHQNDPVLIGYGFRDGLWPDAPNQALLAQVAPGRPVVLVSNDLHAAWLNREALRRAGHGDHPTGLLRERAAAAATRALTAVNEDDLDRWVHEATTAAAARGVVGLFDFEQADTLTAWQRREAGARLSVRVVAVLQPPYLDRTIDRGLRTGDLIGRDSRIEVGPLKLFVDGSLNTRTALCFTPYPETDQHGLQCVDLEQVYPLLRRATAHGITPALHAIGDQAMAIALDLFEELGCGGRIEHAQLIRQVDLARVCHPGLTLGVQPAHATDDRDIADKHWAGRTAGAFAYGALLGAGGHLEIGSDAPVSALDPWHGIASAVYRTSDGRAPWHPEQAISLSDALAAASRGRRSIKVGDPADLVIVDHDPTGMGPHELRTLPVTATIVAGEWTFRRGC